SSAARSSCSTRTTPSFTRSRSPRSRKSRTTRRRSRPRSRAFARATVAAPMRPLLRALPIQLGAVFVLTAMGALGFVPLFDGPGYESALGPGLILPFVTAIATALAVSLEVAPPVDVLARGLATGGLFALLAWLTTMAHGFRTGFCAALTGSEHF